MMAAILQWLLGKDFQVESAGIGLHVPELPANEFSILVAREVGIDLTKHIARSAREMDLSAFSYIVCVGEEEAKKVKMFLPNDSNAIIIIANREKGGIPDPYGKGISEYRKIRDLLIRVISKIALEILQAQC
jgi:protein-tyrosine-phosphatase